MKITKQRLQQIIREELEQAAPQPAYLDVDEDLIEAVVMVAENDGELYQAFESGEIDVQQVAGAASHAYLEAKNEELKDSLFSEPQLQQLADTLQSGMTYTQGSGEQIAETPEENIQHGGSLEKQSGDRDLKSTSTNWRDKEKKKNFQKKFISANPGGARKTYKKQSTKKSREAGKRQSRENS